MSSLTNYSEQKLLDHLFNTAYTPPAAVYLGLCTSNPGEGATGGACNEVPNSGSYQRTAITFGAASSRRVTQNATVTFPTATSNWGAVSHWVIVDSQTYGAGNVLAYGAFASVKNIYTGNTPSVASGQIYVEFLSGGVTDAVAHKLLNLMFRNQAYSRPDTFVALCTVDVADTDTGSSITEPVGNGYARKQVNPWGGSSPRWKMAAGTTPTLIENNDAITFPTATGSWGTIKAVAICSASTAGDVLAYDNAMTDQAVGNGDTAEFPANSLDITLD